MIIFGGTNKKQKKEENTQNKKGRIKLIKISTNGSKFKSGSIVELSVSSEIKKVEFNHDNQFAIFMTDSGHLCFWNDSNSKKDHCFCAHYLNPLNSVNVSSMNHIFMPSPGELNAICINDIIKLGNNATEKRFAFDLKLRPENKYPFNDKNYFMLNNKAKNNVWGKWMEQRKIKQIKKIKNGIIYFIEDQTFFNILICDKKEIIEFLRENKEYHDLHYFECGPINSRVFEYCEDIELEYPSTLDAVQCSIDIKQCNQILNIYVYDDFIMVLDDKLNISIYHYFGIFIRKISISDCNYNDDIKDIEIGFDGFKLWIMLNNKQLFTLTSKQPF